MNLIKPTLSFLIAIFLTSNLIGQDLKQFIPKDAFMVLEINTKRINSKYDLGNIKQYDFMKMLEQEMQGSNSRLSELYKDPTSAGVKENSNYLMYATSKDEVTNVHMLMELADKTKYGNMVKEMSGAEVNSSKDNSFEFVNYEGSTLGWNNKYAVVSFPPMLPATEEEFNFEDLEEMEDMEIDVEMEDMEIEEEAVEMEDMEVEPESPINISPKLMEESMMQMKGVFSTTAKKSILSEPAFAKTMTNNHDIKLYMNYENGMPGRGSELAKMPGMPPAMKQIMDKMYDGYTVDAGFDFNAGAVDVTMNTNMAGDMAKIFRSATNRTLNKNFAKYIKKENLLGYFSMAYNIDNTINTMKDVFSPMKDEIAEAEKGMDGMMQSFGMGMTSNDIYKLLKGDFVIAMTGVRDFEKEVTTFEYDDDFNRKEITKNVKETMPEFVMLFSSDSQENVQKLFDMGKNFSMLAEGDKYYTAAIPGSPMDVKLTMQNGMLIVSNDAELMDGNLKKGLKRKKRIGKSHQKDLLLNSQTFFWDMASSIKIAKAMMPSDPTTEKMMTSLEDSLDNITLNTTKMVGNTMVSKGQISFKNKKMNSIEQFFNILNEMNLIGESGMRM